MMERIAETAGRQSAGPGVDGGMYPKMFPAARRRLKTLVVCAALVVLGLIIYLPGLSNEFFWDDELYISRNPAVAEGLSFRSLRWAFTTFHGGNWHPLTWVSHLADVELFGLKPDGHHLTNLLFHCANTLLTFLLLRRMTGAWWSSALVAALFAVHPLHVESVAWAAERKDVLSTCLWLLAMTAWHHRLRRPGAGRYLVVGALYTAALMAKPMPVTMPFLLLLLDGWPLGRFIPGRRLAVTAEKVPLVLLAAVSSAVGYLAQAQVGTVGTVPLFVRLANVVVSYCAYLGKAILPTRLALLYPFPMGSPSLVRTAAALALLTGISLLVILVRRRAPALAAGWFWFLGTLVPVIGFIQLGPQAMADRYTYVPLTGIFIMAVWGIPPLIGERRRWTPWYAAGAISVLVALTVAARAQVSMWRDPIAAFTNAVRVTKDNRIAHHNLGLYYQQRGDNRQAEQHYREAIGIWQGFADAHCNLGLLLEGDGRTEEAIREYRAAIRANPRLTEAYYNLGTLLADAGQPVGAEINLRQALKLRPDDPEARVALGEILARRGRGEEALTHLREAVRLSSTTALYHGELGSVLAVLGRLDEAIPHLREALRLDPGFTIARENLVKALSRRAAATGGADPPFNGETPSRQAPRRRHPPGGRPTR